MGRIERMLGSLMVALVLVVGPACAQDDGGGIETKRSGGSALDVGAGGGYEMGWIEVARMSVRRSPHGVAGRPHGPARSGCPSSVRRGAGAAGEGRVELDMASGGLLVRSMEAHGVDGGR